MYRFQPRKPSRRRTYGASKFQLLIIIPQREMEWTIFSSVSHVRTYGNYKYFSIWVPRHICFLLLFAFYVQLANTCVVGILVNPPHKVQKGVQTCQAPLETPLRHQLGRTPTSVQSRLCEEHAGGCDVANAASLTREALCPPWTPGLSYRCLKFNVPRRVPPFWSLYTLISQSQWLRRFWSLTPHN